MSTETLKITKDNLPEILVNKMFEIIGSQETYKNLIETKNETWYQDNTWNKTQEDEFLSFARPLVKKLYRINNTLVDDKLMWFLLKYGLKRNDYEK